MSALSMDKWCWIGCLPLHATKLSLINTSAVLVKWSLNPLAISYHIITRQNTFIHNNCRWIRGWFGWKNVIQSFPQLTRITNTLLHSIFEIRFLRYMDHHRDLVLEHLCFKKQDKVFMYLIISVMWPVYDLWLQMDYTLISGSSDQIWWSAYC